MYLSDYFDIESIVRDAAFDWTMHPRSRQPNSICYAVGEYYLKCAVSNPNITAVITNTQLAGMVTESCGLVVADNPQHMYYDLHNFLVDMYGMAVHTDHFIHPTARIAETSVIGRRVIIEEGVEIAQYSVIGDYTILGANTYVGEQVVIGARGMQNLRISGHLYPVKYAGGVKIGERCEILAGAVIQRPYHAEYTMVGNDTQVSAKVVIGHGVRVGSNSMIGGSSQIAGNVEIGDHVWIGPSSTVSDHVKIADKSQVKLGSVVVEDLPVGSVVSGNFAVAHKEQLRMYTKAKHGRARF